MLCHQGHKQIQEAAEIHRSTMSNIEWSLMRLVIGNEVLLAVVIPGTNDIPDVRMDIDILRSVVRPKAGVRAYSAGETDSVAGLLDATLVQPFSYHAQAAWPEQRVHRGFYRGYLSIRDELLEQISASDEQIVVVGHSLGGAVGVLAAVDSILPWKADSPDHHGFTARRLTPLR